MFSGKPVIAWLHRHNPWLDVEIAQKLFPDNLHVAAGYHIWPAGILSRLLSSLSPIPLVGQAAKHTGLGRTDSRSSIRLRVFRTIPQVVQPSNALGLRVRSVWIHVGIREIPIHVLIVKTFCLRLTIGSHERREV